jgi:putative heme-binding domain-containing protein
MDRMWRRVRAMVLVCSCWSASPVAAVAQQSPAEVQSNAANLPELNPYSSADDVEAGRKLYIGRCGHCHGLEGEGGRGAVLNRGDFRHGESDRDLFRIIRSGIPDTEMPGVPGLPAPDVWRLVAYVRQLGKQGASEPITGDAAAGVLVYQRRNCASCHSIDGQGAFFGPVLTGIGAKRSVRYLRDSIVNPNADVPLDYRSVTVITLAGRNVTGIHLNEDEYSIHVRDMSGVLWSFLKTEVREIRLTGQSLMPAYSSLSSEELENLVAYLSSLRPTRRP